jgi:glucokinase
MASSVLGVDIGGTKVAAGLVNDAGEILSHVRVPMIASGSAEEGFDSVCNAISSVMESSAAGVRAIGVSSPGPLDPGRGVILKTPNLPCWRNFPLLDAIEQKYGLPTRVENDANAAGLAEAIWGAGADYQCLFYVTIGTGVGTAIIQNKRIYNGRTGLAAEGGHMTIDLNAPVGCGCGKRGCLESMVSGPAIARRGREHLSRSSRSGNESQNVANLDLLTTEAIFEASEAGDLSASGVIQETTDILALWLGNIVDLLEPDVIVLGGGVGARLSSWLPKIRAGIPGWTINPRSNEIPLLPARYRADSGLAGAAALWLPNVALNQAVSQASSD